MSIESVIEAQRAILTAEIDQVGAAVEALVAAGDILQPVVIQRSAGWSVSGDTGDPVYQAQADVEIQMEDQGEWMALARARQMVTVTYPESGDPVREVEWVSRRGRAGEADRERLAAAAVALGDMRDLEDILVVPPTPEIPREDRDGDYLLLMRTTGGGWHVVSSHADVGTATAARERAVAQRIDPLNFGRFELRVVGPIAE